VNCSAKEQIMSAAARLPSRVPAGTKFVIEGEDAPEGALRIVKRYLVYPDGTRLDLMAGAPRLFACCTGRAASAARNRRAARHRQEPAALQLQ
jgi:hypothetical protein